MTTAKELTAMLGPDESIRVLAGGIGDRLSEMVRQLDIVFETVELVSCEGQPDYDAMRAARRHLAELLRTLNVLQTLAENVQRGRDARGSNSGKPPFTSKSVENQQRIAGGNHPLIHPNRVPSGEVSADYDNLFRNRFANTDAMPSMAYDDLQQGVRVHPATDMAIASYEELQHLKLMAPPSPAKITGFSLMHTPEPATGLATRAEKTRTAVERIVEFRDRLQGVMAPAAKREKEKQDRQNDTAAMVFSYWQVVMGKQRAVMDPTRVTRIKTRLRENNGDVSELLYAIDGARNDDWLMGRDSRSKGKNYNGIETIFRDREMVEKLAERVGGYKRCETHPSLKLLDPEPT